MLCFIIRDSEWLALVSANGNWMSMEEKGNLLSGFLGSCERVFTVIL